MSIFLHTSLPKLQNLFRLNSELGVYTKFWHPNSIYDRIGIQEFQFPYMQLIVQNIVTLQIMNVVNFYISYFEHF
jgi:hypothetical protein